MIFNIEGKYSIGDVMSNYDHKINENAEEKLKEDECFGEYPAWNFHGIVYYNDGSFLCRIKRYGQVIDVIKSESLQGIMDMACKKYGDD